MSTKGKMCVILSFCKIELDRKNKLIVRKEYEIFLSLYKSGYTCIDLKKTEHFVLIIFGMCTIWKKHSQKIWESLGSLCMSVDGQRKNWSFQKEWRYKINISYDFNTIGDANIKSVEKCMFSTVHKS